MIMSKIGKILVVDDEVELKNILVESLTNQGYQASGFTSSKAAIKALREQAFDVLLTDLMMPEMDGLSLMRAGFEIDPHLICIMMTGHGTIQTAVDAMKFGAFDYVLKPFRLQTVLPVLTRAMNTRHMRLENLQLRETVAIYELAQTIAFTLDPQTVISKLADAALQQTDADQVSVLLPAAERNNELYVAAVRGENRERLLGERVPLDESISGWVARQREPLILDGKVNDARFRSLWPHPEIRSAISIPMQVANKLVGIININALNRPRPFTLGQMKALTILASTAAAALESASLYGQVRQAEENYRSIFENAVEGIFQSTLEGRFITVNPAMARILGYESPEEMIAKITDVTHQLYVDPSVRENAAQLQAERGVLQGFEFEAYRKNRERIWLSLKRRSVRDENGVELYREGTIEDITERRKAEAALRASEAEMRALFASMTDVIIQFDDQGRHLKIAPTKSPHLYKPAAERIGKTIHEIFPKEQADFFLAQIQIALAKGHTQRVEYSLSINETEYWYDGSISPMTENSVIWVARDITERKQAEAERAKLTAEIESQRQRLHNIVATVPGVVWEAWVEPDAATQRINFVSSYVETMLGYSVEEWVSTPNFWLQIIHPDDKERAANEAAAAFASTKSIDTIQFRWMAKDGSALWVESTSTVIKDDEGQPVGVRGVTTDISERKRTEEALAKSEERYRALVESLPAMIYYVDADPPYSPMYLNSNIEALGYSTDEWYSKPDLWVSMLHPDDRGRVLRETEAAKTAGVETEYEYRVVAKDGSIRWLHDRGRFFTDPSGARTWQGVILDITEGKRAEEALRESEERYRDLVENAHDIVFSHDLNGKYTSVSRAGEQITGYTHEECLRLNIADTIAPEYVNKAQEMIAKKVAGEKVTAYEIEILAKDGRRVAVEINSKLMYRDGVPVGVQGIARDMTARKQLEDQLRQSQKMEAIGQLAGGIAHDFNNLLTAINGYSSLALQRMNGNDPTRGYLEEIKKAGDRAANLTRQLLAFGRKQILQPLALNLNDIITDMNKLLRRLIGEDIVLTAKLDPVLKKIKPDPGQIEQILVNLVVNARDAMPQGGNLTIETATVELHEEYTSKHVGVLPGNYAMLAISDTGVGMSEETQARIFDPFFTTKEKGKGTGLGLSTVYGIVKQSGGNIWVYSEPGHGTTFKIYLPQLESPATQTEIETKEEAAPRGSETILLVEDEAVVRGLARQILEQAGYKVLEASGGEEAVHLTTEHSGAIDLVLTDVVMPKASGKEIAELIKSIRPDARVLFMSGYTDEAIVHHGVLDSGVEFIQKPFTPASLARKVREVLESEQPAVTGG